MPIFETHAHYDSEQYDDDRDELLTSLPSRGVEGVVNMGARMDGCHASIELARTYPHVYARLEFIQMKWECSTKKHLLQDN